MTNLISANSKAELHQFEAVIFDMDGLIIDSEPFWRQAEIKVFATVGVPLTDADCIATTGFRFDEVVEYWWNKKPWKVKSKQQIFDEVLNEMELAIAYKAAAMPGVYAAISEFKKKGLKLAIASSSAMRLIKATVQKLGLENKFDFLVSAESELYGKPHPAVFIRAANLLHVKPEKCLVLEDSLNGILAAKSAKMKCIAVPEMAQFTNPKFAIADWKIKSLEEIQTIIC